MSKIERAPGYPDSVPNNELLKKYAKIFLHLKGRIKYPENEETSHENEIIESVADANRKYIYWDKAKYKAPFVFRNDPVTWWRLLTLNRRINSNYFYIGGISFQYYLTNSLEQELFEITQNFSGSLSVSTPLQVEDNQYYLISSIMEEAIASSQIEGAVTTRQNAKNMLRQNRQPRNQSEQMILNNYKAIEYIRKHKNDYITPEKLLEIHQIVTNRTTADSLEKGIWRFRHTDDVSIMDEIDGEIVHHPPAADKLLTFITDLCRFFNDEQDPFFIHPLMKACIIHFLIGYFHPFTDGNGRTARTLFYWYLLRRGYWLTEYLSISRVIKDSRAQYYRAFQYVEADDNDVTYFIQYQIKALRQAYNDLLKYLERKQRERREASKLQRIQGLNSRQALILQWFREDDSQVLTAKEIEIRLRISNQTARTDLQGLVDRGFLEKISVNRKEQRYGKSDNAVWETIRT
jgi:Fic family protein